MRSAQGLLGLSTTLWLCCKALQAHTLSLEGWWPVGRSWTFFGDLETGKERSPVSLLCGAQTCWCAHEKPVGSWGVVPKALRHP